MKNIALYSTLLMLFVTKVEARSFEIWRTTIARGPRTDVQVTTAPAYVHKVEVAFGTGATNASFQIFGGTWAGNKLSTGTAYGTGTSGDFYYPLCVYPTGFMFSSVGGSTVTAFWDYLYKAPGGLESTGLSGR